MMSSQPSPKLPKWIFFLTDAVLILTAWFIANRNHGVLSSTAMFAIVACVIVGAIVGTVPLILHYEQLKNETLDDRQRALEALASTLTTAAEQISIAAQGLHEITELAQKNLKHAEQLPQKLQDKVTELQAQLTVSRDEEREELKKELAALRATDSERLASIADKVQKSAADLSKLESSTQKSLAAVQAALAKAPETITTAANAALAEIESRLAARTAAALSAVAEIDTKRAPSHTPESAGAEAAAPMADPGPPGGVERRKNYRRATDVGQHITPIVPPTSAPFTGHIISVNPEFPGDTPEPFGVTAGSTKVSEDPAAPAPDAPASPAPIAAAESAPAPSTDSTANGSVAEENKPAKKRAPRKPKPTEEAGAPLDLGIAEPAVAAATDDAAPASADDSGAPSSEPAISSDGATRLLVTAYIGIGNRLFIRGDGPGLAWDKGVPLQFVSIGKWRWESGEATSPVKFKLYKNDETESVALGAQTLDAGRQQEVTATF
ncbi:MAG: hypothetical protein JWM35_1580 [Verrucomicrobia bacterium]|nr:hypothetical protein [Verrucomicrobiota bacterium]